MVMLGMNGLFVRFSVFTYRNFWPCRYTQSETARGARLVMGENEGRKNFQISEFLESEQL